MRDTPDWWRPARFMRLTSGRLWVPDAAAPAAFATAPPCPLPDRFPPTDAPIGRGGDLVELHALLEATRRPRRGSVAFIAGPPGHGRAALAHARCAFAVTQGAQVLIPTRLGVSAWRSYR